MTDLSAELVAKNILESSEYEERIADEAVEEAIDEQVQDSEANSQSASADTSVVSSENDENSQSEISQTGTDQSIVEDFNTDTGSMNVSTLARIVNRSMLAMNMSSLTAPRSLSPLSITSPSGSNASDIMSIFNLEGQDDAAAIANQLGAIQNSGGIELPVWAAVSMLNTRVNQVTIAELYGSIKASSTNQQLLRTRTLAESAKMLEGTNKYAYSYEGANQTNVLKAGRANISPSGSITQPKPEKKKKKWWQKLIGALLIVVAIVCPVVLVAMMVTSMVTKVITQFGREKLSAKDQEILDTIGFFSSPGEIIAEISVDIVCELGGYDAEGEGAQKVKKYLAMSIDLAIALIVTAIMFAASVMFTAGTTTGIVLAIASAMFGLIIAAAGIYDGIIDLKAADKEEALAEVKKYIEKIQALLEHLLSDIKSAGNDIDLYTAELTATLSSMQEEYERTSKMLNEISNSKMEIARNFKA